MKNATTNSTVIAANTFAQYFQTTWQKYPRPDNTLLNEVLTELLLQVNGSFYNLEALEKLLVKMENVHRLTKYTHNELVDMKVFMFLWDWLYQNTNEVVTMSALYQHCYLPLMGKVLSTAPQCTKPKPSLFLVDF